MNMLITARDLVDMHDGELRVPDILLTERLGMADPHKIRDLIKANMDELEAFGGVSARRAETSAKGGRPGTEYLLNEPQAICVAQLSRAPRAREVRAALISLYMEVRHGAVQTPPRQESIAVAKDEYIDLLRSKIALLEGWAQPRPKKPAPRPLSDAERAEILRLDAEGLGTSEIARRIGRSASAVSLIRAGGRG